jgi:hypothetical protein
MTFDCERDWAEWLRGHDPGRGLVAVRELRRLLWIHEHRHVLAARKSAWDWESIAMHLGVRRQTAHGKWAGRLGC